MQMTQMTMFGVRGERARVRPPRTGRRDARTTDGRGRHADSLAARAALDPAALTGRRAQIVAWLAAHGPATDRQVRDGLYGPAADMNMVRPRVTELLDAQAVEEVDRVRDPATGMMVRRVGVTGGGNAQRPTLNAQRSTGDGEGRTWIN